MPEEVVVNKISLPKLVAKEAPITSLAISHREHLCHLEPQSSSPLVIYVVSL